MKRIMVIGCGGSGKTTLSKHIHAITGLEMIHLDQVFWNPGWRKTTGQEWMEKNKKILTKESWIMDGNYGSTMDLRLEKADTLIFLDIPTYIRLFRVIKRTLTNYGKTREDLPADCPEKLSLEFLHYILLYNKTRRPKILAKLNAQQPAKKVFVLRNKKEIRSFLKKLQNGL